MTDTIPIPRRMKDLPIDKHGRVVPWFVAWPDGKPDHRLIAQGALWTAVKFSQCWLCGDQLGAFKAFLIGPMCAVNRITSEPPSHFDCAHYAVRVCPFLTTPAMVRRERGLPDGVREPAGEMIRRNPGAAVLWVTRRYDLHRANDGVLFQIGDPVEVLWFAEGRSATRAEAQAAIDSGMPLLREIAARQGGEAPTDLDHAYRAALGHLPAGA